MLRESKNIAVFVGAAYLAALGSLAFPMFSIGATQPPETRPSPALDPFADPFPPEFTAAYTLAKGQDLKYIPPPYIPQRRAAWNVFHPEDANTSLPAADNLTQWYILQRNDGVFGDHGMLSGRSLSVREEAGLLRLRVQPWQIEGDAHLLDTQLLGDWVMRVGATQDGMMRGFAAAISQATGKKLVLEHNQPVRDVVVLNANAVPHADSTQPSEEFHLKLKIHGPDNESSGLGLAILAMELTESTGTVFLPDSGYSRISYTITWVSTTTMTDQEIVDGVIADISNQSKVVCTRQRRPVDIWTLKAADEP